MKPFRTKSGPRFSPVSLERQLESSVAYEREKWLQAHCVPSHTLLSEFALREVHDQLRRVVSR